MAITQEQQNKVHSWLTSKIPLGAQCPLCHGSSFGVQDIIAAPTLTAGGGMQIGGPTVPMLPVVCTNCAYVMLLAAVPMGLAGGK